MILIGKIQQVEFYTNRIQNLLKDADEKMAKMKYDGLSGTDELQELASIFSSINRFTDYALIDLHRVIDESTR